MSAILIKNGRVIHADKQVKEDILIQGGTIVGVGNDLGVNPETVIIDATDKLIFPGVIDPHTHMGIPIKSGESADNFATGSRSALHGGVTSILDFTVLEPGQSLLESWNTRRQLAEASVCDVGLHVNISRFEQSLLDEIPKLITMGFNSFKVFTTYEEAGMMLSYPEIERVAEIIGQYNGVLMVHSEDNTVITNAMEAFKDRQETSPQAHGISRPPQAELVAIEELGEISKRTQCTIYIVHLNTSAGLAKASEYPLLKVETCPHYLLLDERVYLEEMGRMFVASPPLRTVSDQKALWQGIIDGTVHTVGSDHCPFCVGDKKPDIPFQDIPNGMGGVESLFPTLLAQFIEQGLDLSLLVKLTSSNPAEIFGLDFFKGRLSIGADADILIVDPSAVTIDWESQLDTILDWNAYIGLPAIFPETVIKHGQVVVQGGKIQSPRPGKLLRTLSAPEK